MHFDFGYHFVYKNFYQLSFKGEKRKKKKDSSQDAHLLYLKITETFKKTKKTQTNKKPLYMNLAQYRHH